MHHSGKSGMHNVLFTIGFVYYHKKAVTKVFKIIMQLPFRLWNGKKTYTYPRGKVLFVARDISKGLTIAKVQRFGSTAQT